MNWTEKNQAILRRLKQSAFTELIYEKTPPNREMKKKYPTEKDWLEWLRVQIPPDIYQVWQEPRPHSNHLGKLFRFLVVNSMFRLAFNLWFEFFSQDKPDDYYDWIDYVDYHMHVNVPSWDFRLQVPVYRFTAYDETLLKQRMIRPPHQPEQRRRFDFKRLPRQITNN